MQMCEQLRVVNA